jgi:hypothetical protein
MFTQLVVFATPPFAFVKAIFLIRALRTRSTRPGDCMVAASPNRSSTRHREDPFLSRRAIRSPLIVRGLRLGLYLHSVDQLTLPAPYFFTLKVHLFLPLLLP